VFYHIQRAHGLKHVLIYRLKIIFIQLNLAFIGTLPPRIPVATDDRILFLGRDRFLNFWVATEIRSRPTGRSSQHLPSPFRPRPISSRFLLSLIAPQTVLNRLYSVRGPWVTLEDGMNRLGMGRVGGGRFHCIKTIPTLGNDHGSVSKIKE
jgi:hypothetical protein